MELVLLFLLALALTVAARYLHFTPAAPSQSPASQLQARIAEMKAQAEAFNSPSTFAKYAKMTREITREEQRLQLMQQENRPEPESYEMKLAVSLVRSYAPYAAVVFFLGAYYRMTADIYVGLWPVSALLGSLQDDHFDVSLVVWYLVCCGVARQAVALIAR